MLVTIHLGKAIDEKQVVPLKMHLNRTCLTRFFKTFMNKLVLRWSTTVGAICSGDCNDSTQIMYVALTQLQSLKIHLFTFLFIFGYKNSMNM